MATTRSSVTVRADRVHFLGILMVVRSKERFKTSVSSSLLDFSSHFNSLSDNVSLNLLFSRRLSFNLYVAKSDVVKSGARSDKRPRDWAQFSALPPLPSSAATGLSPEELLRLFLSDSST